jgi:hypothetical protein
MFDTTRFNTLLTNADSATLQLQEFVFESGQDRAAIVDAVTTFVAREHKIGTRNGQRGLTFDVKGDAFKAADNRRTYLTRLIYNVPKSKGSNATAKRGNAVEKLLKQYAALTAGEKRSFKSLLSK